MERFAPGAVRWRAMRSRLLVLTLALCCVPAAKASAVEQTSPLSADGRFRAYQTGVWGGVKVTDRTAGGTEYASVDSDGRFQPAEHPALDWSGRDAAFDTKQPLVVDDTNLSEDVYVRDSGCPYSDRISVAPGGAQADGGSQLPAISGDGRYVAFVSGADNLVAGDDNTGADVFVADRATGKIDLVSLDSRGRQAPGTWADRLGAGAPAISADGRYVAFATYAPLTPDDTNGTPDVYRRDRLTGTTERVSVGGPGGTDAGHPSISADGGVVAFDWVPNGYGGVRQAWARDMGAGETFSATEWPVASAGRGLDPSVSADGDLIAFSGNPLWGDEGVGRDFDATYVFSRTAGTAAGLSYPGQGGHSDHVLDISANGRFVSWTDAATTGGVYDRGPGAEHPVPALTPYSAPCRPPVRSPYRSAVLDDRPLGYWRLGEVPASWTGHDEMDPQREIWLGGHTAVPGALAGDPNTALRFGGAAQYFTPGYYQDDFAGHDPFTLEAWIRPAGLNANTRRVFSSETADAGYLVGVRSDGIVFSRHAGGRWSTLKAPVHPGAWTHVVATYDTSQVMRLYVNGVRTGALASTLALPAVTNFDRQLEIGALRGRWRFYEGDMDEVAVYDHALSPERVAAHYRLATG